MYIASQKRSENYKAQPYQYASPSKHILKAKAKPFPPCTHYGFNDHRSGDCKNYPECGICGSYDHFTSGHKSVRHIREPIWYLDSRCSRSMTDVKSYLHKYVEQPGLKVVYGDNSSCITEGYGSINCGVRPISINHEKYTLVIVDEYSRYTWVYFLRKKSQAPEMIMSFMRMVENQNDVKVKKIRTDNGTEFRNHELESFFRIACHTQNSSIIVKRHDKTSYEIFRERIPNISYFHDTPCSKAFRVFNTRRQQMEETYHVTFDESLEAIINSDISYYVIPYGRSLTELTQENNIPEVIVLNEPDVPLTKDTKDPPNLINTEGIHEQNIQDKQIITRTPKVPSGNSTKEPSINNTNTSIPAVESSVPNVPQYHIPNPASTSSHPSPQDRWSREQHIKLIEGMLTRSMVVKLIAASANECLFADFLSKIEPKKVSEALKHPGWINAMQEELN
ncbi:retrovirus-related pol polyprotein from transposon TNT 1-94 [Tanacetum coccineum]